MLERFISIVRAPLSHRSATISAASTRWISALLALFGVVGCADDCAEPVIGMSIRLLGGAAGSTCAASVVIARAGENPLPLSCRIEAPDCVCEGAKGAPGSYTISIQRGSTVIDSAQLVVEDDACEYATAEFSVN